METIDLHSLEILTFPGASAPVMTAAAWLKDWLRQGSGVDVPLKTASASAPAAFHVVIGSLDQPEMAAAAKRNGLPGQIRSDGYALALRGKQLFVYSRLPRGVVYACGYEIPRHASITGSQLSLDVDLVVEQPTDDLRGFITWNREPLFVPHAAMRYRMNMTWPEGNVSGEALLPGEPALQAYIQPHAEEIRRSRELTGQGVALAQAYGMMAFVGGLGSLWTLPDYLFEGLVQAFPDALAHSYQGGSLWPPYEWQDRPQLCPSSEVTRRIYRAILDEYMAAHADADGFAFGVGYDGYPLGCGCPRCQNYAYADRFRDQAMLVYDVVVKKYHKKVLFWSWVVGGASAIPGYAHFYGWVKQFAEENPQAVIISSFATEGDFNITHPLNPAIGSRGPQDMGNVLLWPEYRGDGPVPAWLVDWMADSFPVYRSRGARGFFAVDTRPENREKDLIMGAELYAFGELTWDGEKTAEETALEYCQAKFGSRAAPLVAAALRKSSEVIAKTLYLPDGVRFSGHSHIENDLRVMWDVYTLYDSGPFFLTEEQRQQALRAGPPYQPKIEAALPGLAISDENVAAILQGKDEAVAGAGWMLAQLELAQPHLAPEHYEQLQARFTWSLNYARLFRGLARAFFHLRLGRAADGAQVIAGAAEMSAAMEGLPQSGLPLPYDIQVQFGGYPWMVTPPLELINALKAAGELLAAGIAERPLGLIGCEEAAAALDSLYLPYRRVDDLRSDVTACSAVVLGPAAMQRLAAEGENLASYVKGGGKVLLYNPTENWESLPAGWLPGKVEAWACNHPAVKVTLPAHPVTRGYRQLRSEPITRFQATSAVVAEAARFSPFIKSFVAVSNPWTTLTYPPVLAETAWGSGFIFIDLIPENRTVLLRSLAYLTSL